MRALVHRIAPAVAAVLTMAGAVTVAGTTSASASGWGCSGNEVSGSPYPVKTSAGAVYSYVHLFWDGSTGKNCAVNVKTGSLYGTPTWTQVIVYECAEDTPVSCNAIKEGDDGNNYSYYAGPASVPAVGHCVVVQAWTDDTAGNEANFAVGPFHC
ncbi:hypothetical protein ACFW1A_07220 [Kitasatospora sp. NPDC058965]|uniref:hypothetical protein n=1 Tax=Kitasatospora sp. NPDC058965 TaxID=3346682 RepID=UPI0036AD3153